MRVGSRTQDPGGKGQGARGREQEAAGGIWRLPLGLGPWDWGSVTSHLSFVTFPLLLLWRPLFAGEAFYWGTPLLQFVPWQRMAAATWRAGYLPLWNPLVGCGAPLAANYQTAAFYPLNLLYLLLPAEVALSWTTALHLALAGWGMYRWRRAAGLDRLPAFIGAMALEGSGFLVARAALFPSMVFTFPWLAVWLWRAEVLVWRRQIRDALWLGLALGLGLLAGHAQTAFYGGVLLVAYLAYRTLVETRGRRRKVGSQSMRIPNPESRIPNPVSLLWPLILCAFVVGVGLAAVQLLPTAELMLSSQRSGGVGEEPALTYSFWPWRLITFAAPDFFGNPGRHNYWGYPNYWEGAGYVGVLPLLLAMEAVISRQREKGEAESDLTWFWVIVATIALLLALGKNTPIFPFLFRFVPTFDLFQAPARWLAVVTIALAALASGGAQRWPVGHRAQRRGALGVAVGLSLLIGGLIAPWIVPDMPDTFGPATAWLGGLLSAAGALALLPRDTAWRHGLVGGFILLDLLIFGWSLVPTVDLSLYHDDTEAAAYLSGEPGAVRVYWPVDLTRPDSDYGAEYRVKFGYLTFDDFGPHRVDYWWGMREALLSNAGMLDGVASVNNFEPLLVGWYAEFLDAIVETPSLLRLTGATHVASDRRWPGGEPVHISGPGVLYRLPDALGRVWVVPSARQVGPDEMLAALADPAFDPTTEVLLEHSDPNTWSPMSSLPHSASGVEYQIALQDTPNGVTIHAGLDAPGYLVVADTWYPGWRATVDGEEVELLRANYVFRAVLLGAGDHVVRMLYQPLWLRAGAVLSLGTLVVASVAGLARPVRSKVLSDGSNSGIIDRNSPQGFSGRFHRG
jgi:hypothetical protein